MTLFDAKGQARDFVRLWSKASPASMEEAIADLLDRAFRAGTGSVTVPEVPTPPRTDQKALTERQRRVYEFLVAGAKSDCILPTLREVSQFMGLRSANGAAEHLNALERKGYIYRDDEAESTRRPFRLVGLTFTQVLAHASWKSGVLWARPIHQRGCGFAYTPWGGKVAMVPTARGGQTAIVFEIDDLDALWELVRPDTVCAESHVK